MHLILTGATGLVGSGVLDMMLRAKDITKISIISRRAVPMVEDRKDPRVNVIIQKDFEKYDSAVLEQLKGAAGCVWALGISQTKVGAEEYVKITKDYAIAAAEAFSTIEPESSSSSSSSKTDGKEPFRFVYVSGEGATQEPGRFSAIFARVKGETETLLGKITEESSGKFQAYSVRPAFIDAAQHDAIKPYVPVKNMLENSLEYGLGPLIRCFYKSFHSPTPFLGECFSKMAMGQLDGRMQAAGATRLGGSWVVPNASLRRLMDL